MTFTPANIVNNDVPSNVVVDASTQYVVVSNEKMKIQIYGKVNNLFDRAPPLLASTNQNFIATNQFLYDTVGRAFGPASGSSIFYMKDIFSFALNPDHLRLPTLRAGEGLRVSDLPPATPGGGAFQPSNISGVVEAASVEEQSKHELKVMVGGGTGAQAREGRP